MTTNSLLDHQFDIALKRYPNLKKDSDTDFSLKIKENGIDIIEVHYQTNNFSEFPLVSLNGQNISDWCLSQIIEKNNFNLDLILALAEVKAQNVSEGEEKEKIKCIQKDFSSPDSYSSNNLNFDFIQKTATHLAEDMNSKMETLNGLQEQLLKCQNSSQNEKSAQARALKDEVATMKSEIDSLKDNIALCQRQFQTFLRQMSSMVKSGQINQTQNE